MEFRQSRYPGNCTAQSHQASFLTHFVSCEHNLCPEPPNKKHFALP
uniref:Uncharacterized protein n=1 Tax=Anguilla anguilla TaxID=7936 RepID=A0A0E9QVY5_ANGAN